MGARAGAENDSLWKRRYYVRNVRFMQLARNDPSRGMVLSGDTAGETQVYSWQRPSGQLRQVTHRPGGVLEAWLDSSGRFAYYLEDESGNELGHIFQVVMEDGRSRDITPGMRPYTLRGLYFSRFGNRLAFTPVNEDGFQLYCIDLGSNGETGEPRRIYCSKWETWESMLSSQGELLAAQCTERAQGARRYSTLIFDLASGEQVAELWDGPENSVEPAVWSPLEGDLRLAATTTRSGFCRPLIWNPGSGERRDLPAQEVRGDLLPLDWLADGKRLLLLNFYRAQQQICLYDLEREAITRLDHPAGSFAPLSVQTVPGLAQFGVPGEILATWQNSIQPAQVIALDESSGGLLRTELCLDEAPPGHPWRSVDLPSSDGQEIQGWLAVPSGAGPFPTILVMHGGPHAVETDLFWPSSQTWLDHGFAFFSVNFRGSTTFGQAYKEQIWGDIGHWEMEDMVAARNWLVAQGIARPEAILLHGASYGGFLTLLGLGKRPDLWAGGMAEVAVADWSMNYQDASAALKGAMRGWFGGTPEERPEVYTAASPITYAEQVRAPVIVVQEHNDTRTTPRQMEAYEARMHELGKEIEIVWFDAGHGATPADKAIAIIERLLAFAQRVVER